MNVNILGTEYEIINSSHMSEDLAGECDFWNKIIKINHNIAKEKHEEFNNEVLRHEIIHAFLFECGLDASSDWARNEEMIDFFAIQFKKIYKAMKGAYSI